MGKIKLIEKKFNNRLEMVEYSKIIEIDNEEFVKNYKKCIFDEYYLHKNEYTYCDDPHYRGSELRYYPI